MAENSERFDPAELEQLMIAEVARNSGTLVSWELEQVDSNPGRGLTATYSAVVDWPYGRRDEMFGVSATRDGTDVWLYPDDPELPGLGRATYADSMAEILGQARLYPFEVRPDQLRLRMITYRPRRRAVVRLDVLPNQDTYFIKVLRARQFAAVRRRHEILLGAGVPVPTIAAQTADQLLVLRRLPGRPLAQAIFDDSYPCSAENIIATLDSMPSAVAKLERRAPWTDAVEHYAELIKSVAPNLAVKLDWTVGQIQQGLSGIAPGHEATHGDFHEGQVFVDRGRISGVLDIDTAGPGRRADDLACLVAHLSTIQRMNPDQTARVHRLIAKWVPVFDERVDPIELRLRAAGVIVSLATGPYRAQEPDWEHQTRLIVNAAVALARQVA